MSTYKNTLLTPAEEKFIKLNFETMTVPAMGKIMERSPGTIYSYMNRNDLQPFKGVQAPRQHSHPFRKRNRQLESYVIARRIQNGTANQK
jgi:IS30 family transposase